MPSFVRCSTRLFCGAVLFLLPSQVIAGIKVEAAKITGGELWILGYSDEFGSDGRHGWLRVRPEKIVSWDFRKNPSLRG